MSNIRYLNQQNPFWDWASTLESAAANHPFFNAYNPEAREREPPTSPDGPLPPHHEGPPPPPDAHGPGHHGPAHHDNPFGPGFPFGGRRGGPHHHGGPHGHHGRRGGWGGRGGRYGAGGGGFGGGSPWAGGNFDMNKIAEFISQFLPAEAMTGAKDGFGNKNNKESSSKDFTPTADIFDTEEAYVVHISLPGAKKEDVGVNWDADASELNIAGVIYRPGDEEFLKTLALDERNIGVFDRKIKLGSKERPAQVDSDAISAKMEDGILMITIPKLDHDIVEVKKVDIE